MDKDSAGIDKACVVIADSVVGCCPANRLAKSQGMIAECVEVAKACCTGRREYNAKAKTETFFNLLSCQSITRILGAGV
jgi:hypothetical protein